MYAPSATFGASEIHVRHDSVLVQTGPSTYRAAERYEGDYLLAPPSGAEGRTLRMFVKVSRGSLVDPGSKTAVADTANDAMTATLYVTARGLVVPSW